MDCAVTALAERWPQLAAAAEQASLFSIEIPDPDLSVYDVIVVSVSGGKDSQTSLRKLVRACEKQGIPLSRVVVVFADLGDGSEWPGAAELAAYHAAEYGLRFIIVRKQARDGTGGTRDQSLLERIEIRGHWPSPKQRWCTSDFKRGPIGTVITRLVREIRAARDTAARRIPVRVLSVMGLRAEESTERAGMAQFTPRADVNKVRIIDEWLPIHTWTAGEVWRDIAASKVRHHYAYDLGMGRLSCPGCIYAPRKALVRAARANLGLFAALAAAEQRMVTRKVILAIAWAGSQGLTGGPRPAGWDFTGQKLLRKTWRTAGLFRKGMPITSIYAEAVALGPIRPGERLETVGWQA